MKIRKATWFSKYYNLITKGRLDMKMNRLVWSLHLGKEGKSEMPDKEEKIVNTSCLRNPDAFPIQDRNKLQENEVLVHILWKREETLNEIL